MKSKKWIDLFKKYEWAKLQLELYNESPTNENDRVTHQFLSLILLSSFWGEKTEARNKLTQLTLDISTLSILEKYIDLDSGISIEIKEHEEINSTFSFFYKWIELELIVRSRNYGELLTYFKKTENKHDDWVYACILNSLGYKELNNNSELRTVIDLIKSTKNNNYLKSLLLLRVKGYDKDSNFYKCEYEKLINTRDSNLAKNEFAMFLISQGETKEAIDLFLDVLQNECLNKKHMYELLSVLISTPHRNTEFSNCIDICEKFSIKNIATKGGLATFRIIYLWINHKYSDLLKVMLENIEFKDAVLHRSEMSLQTFYKYISLLGQSYAKNQGRYIDQEANKIYVIGESHALCLNGLNVSIKSLKYMVQTKFIMGIKMHHIANLEKDPRTVSLKMHMQNISKFDNLMFCIGEIDSRPDEGFWPTSKKTGQPLSVVIRNTVRKYIDNLNKMIPSSHKGLVIIQGIPAPFYDPRKIIGEQNLNKFLEMFIVINEELKRATSRLKWIFLDVYKATQDITGFTNKKFHIDVIHLSPDFYMQMESHLIFPKTPLLQSISNKKKEDMTTIKIDDKEYDLDQLSDEVKAQLASMQFCDQELQRLQGQAAALQTARMAYAKALNEALNPTATMGDKISFN